MSNDTLASPHETFIQCEKAQHTIISISLQVFRVLRRTWNYTRGKWGRKRLSTITTEMPHMQSWSSSFWQQQLFILLCGIYMAEVKLSWSISCLDMESCYNSCWWFQRGSKMPSHSWACHSFYNNISNVCWYSASVSALHASVQLDGNEVNVIESCALNLANYRQILFKSLITKYSRKQCSHQSVFVQQLSQFPRWNFCVLRLLHNPILPLRPPQTGHQYFAIARGWGYRY